MRIFSKTKSKNHKIWHGSQGDFRRSNFVVFIIIESTVISYTENKIVGEASFFQNSIQKSQNWSLVIELSTKKACHIQLTLAWTLTPFNMNPFNINIGSAGQPSG